MGRRFTEKEVCFLLGNYKDLGPGKCAKVLGRKKQSIKDKCSKLGAKNRFVFDGGFMRKCFSKRGYTLLFSDGVGADSTVTFLCDNGHEDRIVFRSFYYHGYGCSVCSGKRKKTLSEVKEICLSKGFEVLSDTYVNSGRSKLLVRCIKGHLTKKTFSNIQTGRRCAPCSGLLKKTLDGLRPEFEKEGYSVLQNHYVNSITPIFLECPSNHRIYISWSNFKKGHRCAKCAVSRSVPEKALYNVVNRIVHDNFPEYTVLYSDRSLIGPFELDIYIPDLQLAVEMCGLYWHSDKAGSSFTRQYDKFLMCQKLGVRLITVFDDEWSISRKKVARAIDKAVNQKYNMVGVTFSNNRKVALCDLRWFNYIEDPLLLKGYIRKEEHGPLLYNNAFGYVVGDCGHWSYDFAKKAV